VTAASISLGGAALRRDVPSGASAAEAGIALSITAFTPAEWNACFPADPENWAFYRACEVAGPPGFTWIYAFVREGGRLLAVVPGFGTEYRLDTTVGGTVRWITDRLYRALPRLMSLRLLAAGSPVAEICHLGFAGDVEPSCRPILLSALVHALRSHARSDGYALVAVKDVADRHQHLWQPFAEAQNFHRVPGLPTACLDLPFDSLDGYLASLSRATRRDLRRKRRDFDRVSVETREDVGGSADELAALYEATVARSELRFEPLPREYFAALLRWLAPNARVFLYRAEGRLIAFNLTIEDRDRLIDKYIGMDYSIAHQYNIYFNSWLHNVEYCINNRIRIYQSGQGFYGSKLRLGCRLQPNWHYFRHSSALIDAMLWRMARIIGLDHDDLGPAARVEEAA
jgi:hypothetical protein